MEQQKLQVEISHTMTPEQLKGIYDSVYQTTQQAISDARRDVGIESDILFSKAELRRFLNNCSAEYLAEVLADETFPKGRLLSDRKQCYSKTAVRRWLLENQ
ncbi:hypothetical protein ACLI5Y_13355 [Enterococcus innesii]|uniref:hypothetical protein n=1 Tax=Enterococcus innesii TaxID=2839759 RepID=UPI00398503C3